jgi:hypothetical protein
VYEQPQIIVEANSDALADTSEIGDLAPVCDIERWLETSKKKGVAYANVLKCLAADAITQPIDIQIDIREFRQIRRPASYSIRPGR